MSNLPFFPLYPKEFLGATIHLDAEEFGVYTRLLFVSWIKPLADNKKRLLSAARCSEETLQTVLDEFFTLDGGVWVNNRLEKERVVAHDKHAKRVDAGKKGAKAKQCSSNAGGNAEAMLVAKGVATHNSELITQKTERDSLESSLVSPARDALRAARGKFNKPSPHELIQVQQLSSEYGEEKTLDAIRRCADAGWKVTIMQIRDTLLGKARPGERKGEEKTLLPGPQKSVHYCYACEKTYTGDTCPICGLTEEDSADPEKAAAAVKKAAKP